MADKKTRYTLTAAIGGLQKGSSVELTEAQAASALYAPRIAPVSDGAAAPADADAVRAEVLAEVQAEATKLVDEAKAEAKKIVEAAQAEAMKLAAKPAK